MRATAAIAIALLFVPALRAARPDPPPPALTEMASTERMFARRAAEIGVRDAFLQYFADDALDFEEGVVPAKDGLRAAPSTPPSVLELTWEPRYGDVAASGELGYLTGPATRIVHRPGRDAPQYICYFSIWRRQPDGTFKVRIDVGITVPAPVSFAKGFIRAPQGPRYAGHETGAEARLSMLSADRALNAALRMPGTDAWQRTFAASARVHRNGLQPIVGRDAIVRWAADQPPLAEAATLDGEAAESAEMGYTWGRYTLSGTSHERGHYVRVWHRTATGGWQVVLDLTAPAPSKR